MAACSAESGECGHVHAWPAPAPAAHADPSDNNRRPHMLGTPSRPTTGAVPDSYNACLVVHSGRQAAPLHAGAPSLLSACRFDSTAPAPRQPSRPAQACHVTGPNMACPNMASRRSKAGPCPPFTS
jgi:hypothetical protein